MTDNVLASWNDGPAKQAIVDFVTSVPGTARVRPCRGADRDVRQRRHAVVREADADPARLHPPPARGDGRGAEDLRARQPWQAAYERDYAWFGQLMTDHYAGDDTNVRTLAGASSPRTPGSASTTSRRSRMPSCAAPSIRRSVAAISSARTRRCSTCSRTSRRTGSRTTSPRAAAATSCGRSRQEVYGIPRERVIGSAPTFEYASNETAARSRTRRRPTTSTTARRSRSASGAAPAAGRCRRRQLERRHPDARVRVERGQAGPSPARPPRRRRARVRLHGRRREGARAGRGDGWTVVSVKDDWATVF